MRESNWQTLIRWALFYIFDVAKRDLSVCLVQTREKLMQDEKNEIKYYFRLRFASEILLKHLKNRRVFPTSYYV